MSIIDKFKLTGKVALITGGSRGIGEAIAKAYAEAGADLVLAARDAKQLEKTAADLRKLGAKVVAVPTDVMEESQLESLVEITWKEMGRIDVLVNNAGGSPPKPMLKTSTREFEAAFRFNVTSAFILTRLVAPFMVENGGDGAVINISSMAGTAPASGFAAYGVAKAALSMLTRELAQEFAPKIRVNAIGVGSTRTQALTTFLTPEVEKVMVETTPMGRLGEVDDIAACALYLASPASSYLTGDVVAVNGGLVALNMDLPRAFS